MMEDCWGRRFTYIKWLDFDLAEGKLILVIEFLLTRD